MNQKIRIGIVGYGNVGKGAEKAVLQNQDMELIAVFSRRVLKSTESSVPAVDMTKIAEYKDKIDVMLLCGGSATDLVEQGPHIAGMFHTVDTFDTHAKIPEYFQAVDKAATSSGKLAAISAGWDPGLFSLYKLLGCSILPQGKNYTFWGKGVSQGHSDAIRHVEGVKYAIQYTVPREECIHAVRAGENPVLRTEDSHLRDCYVVLKEGAEPATIEREIKTMPHYFAEYETKIHFISEEDFHKNHAEMPHGGFVFHSGETSEGKNQILEFALKLESNPEFTSAILTAYARAVFRMAKEGRSGAVTVFDIPFGLLSPEEPAELMRKLL